jgi:uncharacterized protein YoxC
MSTTRKGGSTAGAVVGVGATIAAMSAAAYLLFGPEGKKNRKVIRGWGVKMKGEMIEKFEEAQHLTEPVYQAIIDQVEAKYAAVKGIDQTELKGMVSDIRKHWKAMSKKAAPKVKKAEGKAKKVVAKAKKTVMKAAGKKVSPKAKK